MKSICSGLVTNMIPEAKNCYSMQKVPEAAMEIEDLCVVKRAGPFEAFNLLVREDILLMEDAPLGESQVVPWAVLAPEGGWSPQAVQAAYDAVSPENTSTAILLANPAQPDTGGMVLLSRCLSEIGGCHCLLHIDRRQFAKRYGFLADAELHGLPAYPLEILDGKLFMTGRIAPEKAALDHLGITHVADLQQGLDMFHSSSLLVYQSFAVEPLKPTLTKLLPFVHLGIGSGRVLIHFEGASGIAAASVVAFLMQEHELSLQEALDCLKSQLHDNDLELSPEMVEQLQTRCWTFGQIHVEVRAALSGEKLCTVEVDPSASLEDLKAKVEGCTGARHFLQRLLLDDDELGEAKWREVVSDFYAAGPHDTYMLKLHLIQRQATIWDGLRSLLDVFVTGHMREQYMEKVLQDLDRVKSELEPGEATYMSIPGMFGGIQVVCPETGEDLLEVTTSSRMDENWQQCFVVCPGSFREVSASELGGVFRPR